MGILDQGKMLMEARRIQKELRNTKIEVKRADGKIKIILNGEQKVEDIIIDPEILSPDNDLMIKNALKDGFAEAIKKSQQIAANKMKSITGDLNLPGM
jgi:DNA-binding YbaB/EbfC family protein